MARTMHFGHPQDLVLASVWIVATAVLALLDAGGVLRVAFGVPFILVLPGYLLSVALYPQRHQEAGVTKGEDGQSVEAATQGLDPIERSAIALGLSVAVVPLMALALNFTPLGVRATPLIAALALLNGALLAAAWYRRHLVPPDHRPRVALALGPRPGSTGTQRVTTAVLLLSTLLVAGSAAYVLLKPNPGEPFTEFYVLGATGKAADYPVDLEPGETGLVEVVVKNHEQRRMSYEVRALLVEGEFMAADGSGSSSRQNATRFEAGAQSPYDAWNATLDHGDQFIHRMDVSLPQGDYQLQFLLYTPGDIPFVDVPYRHLHLWIQVE